MSYKQAIKFTLLQFEEYRKNQVDVLKVLPMTGNDEACLVRKELLARTNTIEWALETLEHYQRAEDEEAA